MSQIPQNKKQSLIQRLTDKAMAVWSYCTADVWNDSRNTLKVNIIKTANLSTRYFLDQDLQSRACALTYRTILAVVPALALLFAIGRGFGLQEELKDELIRYFPSQQAMLQQSFGFVDSYLKEASGGLFVGIGIVFLLWTLISLLSSVEDSFNSIWHVSKGRSFWRKVTDYLAIFLILPVIMICASGLSLFMTTSLNTLLPFRISDTAMGFFFDSLSVVLTWAFFAGSYMLIPNTKVKPLPAIISGIVVGSAYQVLQWLFVSGQLYVAKYNAIYGSFSFLPLLLIWLQLVWLFTLIGGLMCYASQNISSFNFESKINNISMKYEMQVTLTVMAIIARRFADRRPPLSTHDISETYNVPIFLARPVIEKLHKAGLVNYLNTGTNDITTHPVQPAVDVTNLTAGEVMNCVYSYGDSGFIEGLTETCPHITEISGLISDELIKSADKTLIDTLDISKTD